MKRKEKNYIYIYMQPEISAILVCHGLDKFYPSADSPGIFGPKCGKVM